jgi:large subunit ribosomal protein L31
MKKDVHPKDYRLVVFQDINNDWAFLTRSTVTAEDTIKWEDGNEYPLVKVHISSSSHPFFTGQEKLLDIEGRVDKFKARREAADKARAARTASAKKQAENKEKKDAKKAEKQATTTDK